MFYPPVNNKAKEIILFPFFTNPIEKQYKEISLIDVSSKKRT
jgi:hypothetical protein